MTTHGWSRCLTCGYRIDHIEGFIGPPACPKCYPSTLHPVEIVPEHPVGAGDPELGTANPGPELAAAQIEIRNLEGRIQTVEEVAAEQILEAQRVILQQQTEIADLGSQLTHALAETPDQPAADPSASNEGTGL